MTDVPPFPDRPPRAATGRAASGCPRQASPNDPGLFTRLRIGALACLALLTLQILAADLPPPSAGSAPPFVPPFAQDLLVDRIVICTSAGLIVLDRRTGERIAAETAPSRRTDGITVDDAHGNALCLFCLPLHGNSQTPPPVECPAPVSRPVLWRPLPAASAPLASRSVGRAWPRGPPPIPTI